MTTPYDGSNRHLERELVRTISKALQSELEGKRDLLWEKLIVVHGGQTGYVNDASIGMLQDLFLIINVYGEKRKGSLPYHRFLQDSFLSVEPQRRSFHQSCPSLPGTPDQKDEVW